MILRPCPRGDPRRLRGGRLRLGRPLRAGGRRLGHDRSLGPAGIRPAIAGEYRLTAWKDCDDGLQCATLEVPLDWDDPSGDTVSLAVIRKPAPISAQRIGSVVFNPGGPGEPGTDFLRQFIDGDRIPDGLGDRFDLVSWDPRGTGDSSGVRCITDEQAAEPDVDPTIDSPADVTAIDAEAATLLAGCEAESGDVWTHVGTRDTVRDLDALRAALGDEQLTYVGYSYGTTVGIEYGRMFPDHIRAMVLDGVALPATDPVEATHLQARSFEKNFDAFLDDCDNGRRAPSVVATRTRPSPTWSPSSRRAPACPPTTRCPTRRGRCTAAAGPSGSASSTTRWRSRCTRRRTGSRSTWPSRPPRRATASCSSTCATPSPAAADDGTWSHLPEANLAINCADQQVRADDADGDDSLRGAWAKELPLLGSVFATGTPGCFGVPAAEEPLTPLADGDLDDVPPVVVVGTTDDPATPYARSEELHDLLPEASLVTWDSADHTAYGRGSDCLDDPITNYLEELTAPRGRPPLLPLTWTRNTLTARDLLGADRFGWVAVQRCVGL